MHTIWFNGTIYTMQEEHQTVEALVTYEGSIVDLGNEDDLRSKYSLLDEVNLKGNTLFPGFVDSHMHLIGHGESLMRLDLTGCKSKEEALLLLQEKTEVIPAGQWIVGEGWNENAWSVPEPFQKEELDRITPNHPVVLKRTCRHMIAVNSLVLSQAGIVETMLDPVGGIIDKKDGMMTGLLMDQAQNLVFDIMPTASEAYLRLALQTAIEDCWSKGLVGGHTEDMSYYGGFTKTYGAFQKVIEDEQKHFRAHLLVHHEVIEDWAAIHTTFKGGSEWLEWGAMKIFADGALGGRTALLSHLYEDDPTTSGIPIHSKESLFTLVKKARSLNLPVAVHTIGDLAFEWVLDAVKAYPTTSDKRDRFIHGQILRKELIDGFKGVSAIIDIQPTFVLSDFPWVIDRIGENRMNYNYAWKTLLEEGIHCAGGSDAPIETVAPLVGIEAAVSRSVMVEGNPVVFGEKEKLSVFEAISLFTKGSAYAIHHEHDRGMLKEGYVADFTILKDDPFKVNETSISAISVEMTVVGGRLVYKVER
ncbi:amidohydrolase [Bacillus coahuilensis p1.1.43]|uniref:Amidohydrolase n=1 Tax=Bacillus coahuilensis p1.1.43 TaxID=1150625 RepID=A0A147K6K6_9BACI|nr:amidohydrolase [Bacillus coahuilensis]KUP05552.1 amidohydrolase [Bacillus coahuilensis p1.1.43]